MILDLVEKLSTSEGLFYEKKISQLQLEEVVREITSFLDQKVECTENTSEEECIFALFILLQRIKNSIELERTIVQSILEECEKFNTRLHDNNCEIDELLSIAGEHEIDYQYNMKPNKALNNAKFKQKRTNYSKYVSKILKSWLNENLVNPYPTEKEKQSLSDQTGLNQTQINNWFINARRRILPSLKQQNKNSSNH